MGPLVISPVEEEEDIKTNVQQQKEQLDFAVKVFHGRVKKGDKQEHICHQTEDMNLLSSPGESSQDKSCWRKLLDWILPRRWQRAELDPQEKDSRSFNAAVPPSIVRAIARTVTDANFLIDEETRRDYKKETGRHSLTVFKQLDAQERQHLTHNIEIDKYQAVLAANHLISAGDLDVATSFLFSLQPSHIKKLFQGMGNIMKHYLNKEVDDEDDLDDEEGDGKRNTEHHAGPDIGNRVQALSIPHYVDKKHNKLFVKGDLGTIKSLYTSLQDGEATVIIEWDRTGLCSACRVAELEEDPPTSYRIVSQAVRVNRAPEEHSAGDVCVENAGLRHMNGIYKKDDVSVNGRKGAVWWDGRPEHNYVKVKWNDDETVSEVIEADTVAFLESSPPEAVDPDSIYLCLPGSWIATEPRLDAEIAMEAIQPPQVWVVQ